MDREKIIELIERWKFIAEEYSDKNIRAFIEDTSGNYYMGRIVLVGDKTISIDCDAPKQREGERVFIDWINVLKFEKCRGKGE